VIRTRVAKHLFGENLFFGYQTLAGLVGQETMTGIVAIAVKGRRPTESERRALDAIAVISTSADPHIWPLKLLRLVSSYGSVLAGYCAGQLTIEGERIGYWISGYAAAVLAELRGAVGDRMEDPTAVADAVAAQMGRAGRGRVIGFGVPLRKSDERMDALKAYVAREGLDRGAHWRLQEALADHVRRERGIPPNVGLGIGAVLLDLGYTPHQISALAHFLAQGVFVANALEAAEQRSPEMQKLADEHVDYVGPPRRESPRAVERREARK
jgi:citrate synthase